MKILFDHQAFTIQEYGGISRYFTELMGQSAGIPNVSVANSTWLSNNDYIRRNKNFHVKPFFPQFSFQKKVEAMKFINELRSLALFRRGEFDVFHPTYYDPYYVDISTRRPVVITFHDLIHEKFMRYDERTLSNKRNVLNRADQIIAVSQSSKNDLMEYYGMPSSRIEVIYLASSIGKCDERASPPPTGEYLLYVGSRHYYKNFRFFIRAISSLLKNQKHLQLICGGGGKFTRQEKSLFAEVGISDKVKQVSGTDENLKSLYSGAIAFFCPSIYEGFGLPVVEAMSCGCPVAASHSSSLPEVAGDAALYFNPYEKASIRAVAEELISNSSVRSKLRTNGLKRASDFSWRKTAEKTYELYRQLA